MSAHCFLTLADKQHKKKTFDSRDKHFYFFMFLSNFVVKPSIVEGICHINLFKYSPKTIKYPFKFTTMYFYF